MEGDFTDLFDDVKAVKLVSKVHRCIIPVKQREEKKPFFFVLGQNSNREFPH